MPEAMACGTPVVAFRRGSAPELIRHGTTGYVVDTIDDMVEAVKQAHTIDPAACRQDVAMRFSRECMAAAYVRVYERVLERPHRMPEHRTGTELRTAAEATTSAVA
jgi:glycosyltransferase involved in cell wall biosynthesis